MFLLNYTQEKDKEIRKQIHAVFVEAKNVIDLFQGFNLTFCVGQAVDKISQIEEAKRSCRRASWLRMHYGLNQIIYSEQVEEGNTAGFSVQFKEIRENLEKSFVAMDIELMKEQINRFFAHPQSILCSTDSMQFIRDIETRFSEIYGMVTKEVNTDIIRKKIARQLHIRADFKSYQEELIVQLSSHMEDMTRTVSEKNAKPIRQIYAYIEQHYAEHLSLESVAGLVNLNPVYLSNLFKKESGQNFTEYLTDYRMKKAKEFLKNGDMNINEIADALGYTDARYFSKVFKKEVGVKPTDYRKIYG